MRAMTASNHARAAVADEMKEEPPGEQLETQYAKMVRERLERLRALGESEAAKVGEFFERKAVTPECPFCKTTDWAMIGSSEELPIVMNLQGRGWPVYAMNCLNCGFVRMHYRPVVDAPAEGGS
jgi:hypothetical protein